MSVGEQDGEHKQHDDDAYTEVQVKIVRHERSSVSTS